MVNSNFAFWNLPPKYFWSLVHWLHRWKTCGCGGLTICATCCSLSSTDGHLGCLHLLASGHRADPAICIQILVFSFFFFFFFFGGYTQKCNCWVIWLLWPMTYNYESTCSVGDLGLIPGQGKTPRGVHDNPLQYSCLENSHGQRSLVGYSPWGHTESDMTEQLSTVVIMFNFLINL